MQVACLPLNQTMRVKANGCPKKVKNLSQFERITAWINGLSRPTRIALNMFISIVVMALVGVPLVFIVAGEQVNTIESGEVLYIPSIAIAVLWFALYGFGWNVLVGFDWDEENEWKAGNSATYMVLLGMIAFVFVIFACIFWLFVCVGLVAYADQNASGWHRRFCRSQFTLLV